MAFLNRCFVFTEIVPGTPPPVSLVVTDSRGFEVKDQNGVPMTGNIMNGTFYRLKAIFSFILN